MWTEGLQQKTRELFERMNGAFMKHFADSRFGLCILIDEKYVIRDRGESGEGWKYDSVDEMIEYDWVID